MRTLPLHAFLAFAVAATVASAAFALPTAIPVQGALRTPAGGAVADGEYSLGFHLYTTKDAAEALWTEIHVDVPVVGGFFAVVLSQGTAPNPLPASIFTDNDELWIGVQVSKDPELARTPMHALPWAVRSVLADQAKTLVEPIGTALITDGAITADKLSPDGVPSSKVAFTYAGSLSKGGAATDLACTGCVSAADLAEEAVGTNILADGAVTTAKLAKGAVTGLELAAGAVGAKHVAVGALAALDVHVGPHYTDDQAVAAVTQAGFEPGPIAMPNIYALHNAAGEDAVFFQVGDAIHVVGSAFGAQPALLVKGVAAEIAKAEAGELVYTAAASAAGTATFEVLDTVAKRRSNAVSAVVSSPTFGNGKDGPGALSGTLKVVVTRLAAPVASGANSLNVIDGGGFGVGDKVLIIDLQGAAAGVWELIDLASAEGNTLTAATPLTKSFLASDKVAVQRVPQYTTAQVSQDTTAPAWNASAGTGGVLAFVAQGVVSIAKDARLHMDGRGFVGTNTTSGESWSGLGCNMPYQTGQCSGGGSKGCMKANSGGGGGIFDTPGCPEPSAGGGGHAAKGQDGRFDSGNNCHGEGGSAYGDPLLATLYMGSAGGAIASNVKFKGGSGGGIVLIFAPKVDNFGVISANGTNGTSGNNHQSSGGGAGGSVVLRVLLENVAGGQASTLQVNGGDGGHDTTACPGIDAYGGKGSVGRLFVTGS